VSFRQEIPRWTKNKRAYSVCLRIPGGFNVQAARPAIKRAPFPSGEFPHTTYSPPTRGKQRSRGCRLAGPIAHGGEKESGNHREGVTEQHFVAVPDRGAQVADRQLARIFARPQRHRKRGEYAGEKIKWPKAKIPQRECGGWVHGLWSSVFAHEPIHPDVPIVRRRAYPAHAPHRLFERRGWGIPSPRPNVPASTRPRCKRPTPSAPSSVRRSPTIRPSPA
jgi:hypothetical protein